jgi:hypothetical protein
MTQSTYPEPTPGRIVWYRGTDGKVRAAIVAAVNGPFNLNLFVFPLNNADADCYFMENVTHADPEHEPGCLPSWTWMPYQMQQAANKPPAPGAAHSGYSTMPAHQQRVVDEKAELDDKRTKLQGFFGTPIFAGLPAPEKLRLGNQYDAMNVYSDILGERIAAFAP